MPQTHYEIQTWPPVDGEPWRYTLRITTGFGPDQIWTTQPIDLVATNGKDAFAEATAQVAGLIKILNGEE